MEGYRDIDSNANEGIETVNREAAHRRESLLVVGSTHGLYVSRGNGGWSRTRMGRSAWVQDNFMLCDLFSTHPRPEILNSDF